MPIEARRGEARRGKARQLIFRTGYIFYINGMVGMHSSTFNNFYPRVRDSISHRVESAQKDCFSAVTAPAQNHATDDAVYTALFLKGTTFFEGDDFF